MNAHFKCRDIPVAVQVEPRQYLLRMNLPGLAREEVGVQVEEGILRIVGRRSASSDVSGMLGNMLLPQDVATCSVVADFRDGILQVRLPRASLTRSWWRG